MIFFVRGAKTFALGGISVPVRAPAPVLKSASVPTLVFAPVPAHAPALVLAPIPAPALVPKPAPTEAPALAPSFYLSFSLSLFRRVPVGIC